MEYRIFLFKGIDKWNKMVYNSSRNKEPAAHKSKSGGNTMNNTAKIQIKGTIKVYYRDNCVFESKKKNDINNYLKANKHFGWHNESEIQIRFAGTEIR